MTHTTSDGSLNESRDVALNESINDSPNESRDDSLHESRDESINSSTESKQSSVPKLSVKAWGLLLGGAVILAGGAWWVLHPNHAPETAEETVAPAIAVETLEVHSHPIANTLELSGTIRPLDQATLSTRVMGRITQLSLDAGDRFQRGDVLARIDVMDIAAQTNQAQSAVAVAQAALAERQADLLRSQAMLNQYQSQKIEAQAALQQATIDQRRMAQLQAEGAVSQDRLDQANTKLSQAKAQVAQVEAGIRQAQATIEQSQAAIGQAQASVRQAESGVTSATVSESYGTVIAPFDGVVVQKLAYEGEMAAPGTALLKVEDPATLQLEISVPEENLRIVRVGQPVKVRVEAINQTFNSTIQQIVPSADPNSRSFLVKIPLNHSGQLISGMFGRVAFSRGTQDGISIPTSALIQRGQLQGVYVVESTDSAHAMAVLHWVKTGKTQNGQVEIVSGVMAGDRIITTPIKQLTDGQAVQVRG